MLSLSRRLGNLHNNYLDLLDKSNKYILIDNDRLFNRLVYNTSMMESMLRQLEDIYYLHMGVRNTITRQYILKLLLKMGIPESRLKKYPQLPKMSISKTDVLIPLYEEGKYNMEFIAPYLEYNDLKSSISAIKSKYTRMDSTILEGEGVSKCKRMFFHYSEAKTSRVYSKDENIQGISKDYLDTFVPNKGKIFVSFDLDQIDFRVLYNLFLKDDDHVELNRLMKIYSDSYEAMTRYIYSLAGETFNVDYYKENRGKFKTAMLAGAYLQTPEQMTKEIDNYEIASTIRRVYDTSKKFIAYKEKVEKSQKEDVGIMKLESYFKHTMEEPFKTGENEKAVLAGNMRHAISLPVQSTSTQIKEFVTLELYKRLSKFSNNIDEDFNIYLDRHDEVIIELSEKFSDYLWILQDLSNIAIDDWSPVSLEWKLSRRYTVDDKDLIAKYDKQVKEHEKDFNTKHEFKLEEYYPIRGVLELDLIIFNKKYYAKVAGEDTVYIWAKKERTWDNVNTEISELMEDFVNKSGISDMTVYFNRKLESFISKKGNLVNFKNEVTSASKVLLYKLRNGLETEEYDLRWQEN